MEAERAYLDELVRRLQELLGPELVGVYAGGSWALGGYEPGRSDLDVAVVVRKPLTDDVADRIVAELRNEALPVPSAWSRARRLHGESSGHTNRRRQPSSST